ncbi:uncharacterized protein LOC104901294 [Beta vulgaris subsp. vulgaris]|uniref:uncharacterized protein LOC104901294 n=1 Tax=Beta vulgaris subsp. vulgaris TaxID=3555 RepID=UPI00053FC8DE|nr:uncharacterized protein LOC104901294 [Beta vulgaris subsp. vulgaris]
MMMNELGLPSKFIGWVKACVSSLSFSILINGTPCMPFNAKKGLRQGDRMSPFLFAIGMEYLSRCLDSLKHNPNFNFHPRCERLHITHLMFANDLLMFARANHSPLELLFDAFSKFSYALGLVANLEKSNLYTPGVTVEEKSDLQLIVKMPIESFPLKYLGVPLTTRKLFYQNANLSLKRLLLESWHGLLKRFPTLLDFNLLALFLKDSIYIDESLCAV